MMDEQTDETEHAVWIVEEGCYEQRGIAGVYASLEAAIAAHPGDWTPARVRGWYMTQAGHEGDFDPDGWYDEPTRWTNGKDWDAAAGITRWAVTDAEFGSSEAPHAHV